MLNFWTFVHLSAASTPAPVFSSASQSSIQASHADPAGFYLLISRYGIEAGANREVLTFYHAALGMYELLTGPEVEKLA